MHFAYVPGVTLSAALGIVALPRSLVRSFACRPAGSFGLASHRCVSRDVASSALRVDGMPSATAQRRRYATSHFALSSACFFCFSYFFSRPSHFPHRVFESVSLCVAFLFAWKSRDGALFPCFRWLHGRGVPVSRGESAGAAHWGNRIGTTDCVSFIVDGLHVLKMHCFFFRSCDALCFRGYTFQTPLRTLHGGVTCAVYRLWQQQKRLCN